MHRPVFNHGGRAENPPVLLRKGSVVHQAFRLLTLNPCLLHISVAQEQVYNRLHP
jgi:hypothetical protein